MAPVIIIQDFLQDTFRLSEEEQRRRQEEERRRRKEELRSQLKQSSNQELSWRQIYITLEMELSLIKEDISRRKDKIRSQLRKLSDPQLLLRETFTTEEMEWSLIQEEISRRKKEKLRSQLKEISYDELLYKQTKFRRWPFRHFRLLDDEEMELSLIEEEIRRRKDEIRIQLKKLSYNELLRRQTDINESRVRKYEYFGWLRPYEEMELSLIEEEISRRKDEIRSELKTLPDHVLLLKQRNNESRLRKYEYFPWLHFHWLHHYEEMELSLIKEEIMRRKNRRHVIRATISTTSSSRTTGRILLRFAIVLAGLPTPSFASNTVECPTEQYIQLRRRAVVKCNGLEDFPSIYWYDNTNEDATAFIQKVNGEVTGPGYTAGEFDIDNEGSLVINNVTIRDEKTFRVRVLDSSLIPSSDDVTVTVYAEPDETIPLIPECSGQSTCILKGDSDRVISCIHGESRPAVEVSWFLRDGREDRLLDVTVNHMVSADAVTVTTSAQLAIEEIPIDANINQLVVLVCKSRQPVPNAKDSERVILIDFSVDDPFKNEEYLPPVYAFERQENFMIPCQSEIDTANNVVLWMYKALNSEDVETILYSAYGEVAFTTKGEAGFNITDDGALVIKEVDLQNEGYYACVSSSETTTVSFVQNLNVIVLPKPPRIVVKGCDPFQPCHLSTQEAETITCTVNGVRPQVDLNIVTNATNIFVTKTTVSINKKEFLFYMTVEGGLEVSKDTCRKNVTVICQARGPAAYGFMSDAYVTVTVGGDDCAEASTEKTDDVVGCNDRHLQYGTIYVTTIFVALTVIVMMAALFTHCLVRRRLEGKVKQLEGRESTL